LPLVPFQLAGCFSWKNPVFWYRPDDGGIRTRSVKPVLLPDSQLLNQTPIAIHALLLQIIQEAAALADELQQSTPGMVILLVGFEMLREIPDALAQQSDLDLGRTGIPLMGVEFTDDLLFLLGVQCHV
jgi:hypothetical protein